MMLIAAPVVADERIDVAAPVSIEASRAELDERSGTSTYIGGVVLDYGDLRLTGERLRIEQDSGSGSIKARLEGAPATASRDSENRLVARAATMTFSNASGILELMGDASVSRGSERLAGERIRYDLRADNIIADSDEGSRVRIILDAPGDGAAP